MLRMFSHKEQAHFALVDKESKCVTTYCNNDTQGGFSLVIEESYSIQNFDAVQGTISHVV